MHRTLGAPWFVLIAAVSAVAQAPDQDIPRQTSPFAGIEDRQFRIGRIESAQAPVLDGWLDDPVWQDAPEIGPLVETEPRMGLVPRQDTVVRIIHDPRYLYIAVWCFDQQPGEIRANLQARDTRPEADDRISIIFDTFYNRRTGFQFEVTAGGSRGDSLISNDGARSDRSWDAIWDARSRLTSDGWQVEMVVPFASLNQASSDQPWGLNFRRNRRYSNEEYRWTNARQGNPFNRISEFGTMGGFGETSIGLGVDLVPYLLLNANRQRSVDPDWDYDADVGGEIWYRITPALRAGITVNTDFAETENDERQINFNRFPLFFPEKRDFFLRDSERFTFGNQNRFRPSFVPFFSRRIGLDGSGNEIPILWGVKVAGETGPLDVGFLNVQTDQNETVSEQRNLAVVRLKYAVGRETTVGVIGTRGRPTQTGENSLVGADFYHREPLFIGDQDLRLWAWATTTQTSGVGGDGSNLGIDARAMGREWEYGTQANWIDDEFNPELGFIRRTGIRDVAANAEWRPRPSSGQIRNWRWGIRSRLTVDEDFETTDIFLRLTAPGVRFQTGDDISLNTTREFERINADFTIINDSITISAGEYWTTRVQLQGNLSQVRPVSGRVEASYGDFFDGTSWEAQADLTWRTSPLLILGADYRVTDAELPSGDFVTHIFQGRADFQFSPWVVWNNLVQFDNESDNLGLQSRLRWITTPGSDVFVVFSGGWVRGADRTFRPDTQDFTVKFVHTFRF